MSAKRHSKRVRGLQQARRKKPRPPRGSTRPNSLRRGNQTSTKQFKKKVFVSYRHADASWALAISQNLTHDGFDVFLDNDGIHNGDFERVILKGIRARAHFLVILTPPALERCDTPGDWLRREIEEALDTKRNIVPLMMEGFDFDAPEIKRKLTGKLAKLKRYHGLTVPTKFFKEAMTRLREKFLK